MHRRIPIDPVLHQSAPLQRRPEQAGKTAVIYQELYSRDARRLIPAPLYKKSQPLALPQKSTTVKRLEQKIEQASKKLQESQARLQELQLEPLKQKFKIQQQKIQNILNELKRKNKGALKETLFEKIVNSDECKQYMHASVSNTLLPQARNCANNYSQSVLLDKINKYHTSVGQPKISEEGHCSGITLLWLTMMYLDLEALFYNMVKEIVECPDTELQAIEKKIKIFLEWIDLGQVPEKYSNNTYSQRSVAHIIGGVTNVGVVEKTIFASNLPLELQKMARENHMIRFEGIGTNKHTHQFGAHAIGVFIKTTLSGKLKYCVFDSNYNNNKHKEFYSHKTAAKECWSRAFYAIQLQSQNLIHMDVVKPPEVTQQAFIVPATERTPWQSPQRISLFSKSPFQLTKRTLNSPPAYVQRVPVL
jgi:hypothetical protein